MTTNTTSTAYGMATEGQAGLVNGGVFRGFQAANQMQNFLINGAFDFWQRGTSGVSSSAAGTYVADRWKFAHYTVTSGVSVSQLTASLPTGSTYALSLNCAIATETRATVVQIIESENAKQLIGKTVTFSVLLKDLGVPSDCFVELTAYSLNVKDTAPSSIGSGTPTGSTFIPSVATLPTVSSSWAQSSLSFLVPQAAENGFLVRIRVVKNTGTFGSVTPLLGISQAMLNIGSEPAPFAWAGGTIGGELALCQRYYYRWVPLAAGTLMSMGMANSTSNSYVNFLMPVALRASPISVETSGTPSDYSVGRLNTAVVCSLVPILAGVASSTNISVSFRVASGLIAGEATYGRGVTTNAYLGFDAEL